MSDSATAQKHHTFCRICEALCGLEVTVENNQVVDIKPDHQHVSTGGFACPKGLKQHHLFSSPDRLQYPLKRVGEDYQRVEWKQAISEIGAKVKQLRRDHGPDSIAMYVGTAAGFGVLHPVFADGFMQGLGSKSMYASATQDCSNKFAVSRQMYGFPFTLAFPDLYNTDCLIIVGANPMVSKWSFLQVSNPSKHLKDITKRGGKVYVVDPRQTETAKVAGEHVFIRPNTDVFFYLAFLNEVIQQGGVKKDRVEEYMTGFETVAKLAEGWTPERCAEVTRIPAQTLREMVRSYLSAPNGAALYCSTGVNMGTNGSLAFWIQEVINAVTGNLDKQGGTLVGRGIMDFPKFGAKNGILMSDDVSRIGGFGKTNDAFPGGILADEILTPGDRQIKALFVTGGNPLITMANAGKLRKAFKELELLVVLDILPGETASMSHYMLPCTSPLERADLPFIFPLMLGLQSKPYLQATKPLLQPEGEQRDEASIYLDICRASGVNIFGSAVAQKLFEGLMALNSLGKKQKKIPEELLLTLLLRLTGQPSFKKLLKYPHGYKRDDHRADDFLGNRVLTDDGKVNLAPDKLLDRSQTLEEFFHQEVRDAHKFKLITKRAVTTHNSWTHNYDDFVRRAGNTNHLYMHPEDAARLNLKDEQMVDVQSDTAKVRLPLKLLSDLMPGTVALPHGWGHQHSRLSVAGKTRGVNVNLLAGSGPEKVEKVSGMSHLTGFVVEVTPAAGPQAATWSGLPEEEQENMVEGLEKPEMLAQEK